MLKVICITILFSLCKPLDGFAQLNTYSHQIIGTRDGMQSSKIFTIYQDQSRRLWIGTEMGLSIFDGYNFKNIQYSSSKDQLGRIKAITSDSLGGIWFGGDNGLFYFTENGIKKIHIVNRKSLAIESLITDNLGNIWIGELNGLYSISANIIPAFYRTALSTLRSSFYKGFNNRVYSLSSDRFANLYISGSEAVYLFLKNNSQPEKIWINPNPDNYIRSVAAFSPDSIYWNTNNGHASKKINGKISIFENDDFFGRSVFIHNQKAYCLTTNGLADINTDKYIPIVSFENISNLVHDALIDAENNIWFGSWEGLIKYRKKIFTKYELSQQEYKDAFSMLETSKGEILIGGNRGSIFVKKGNQLVPHPHLPKMFKLAEVMSMYEHTDGSLWFGSGYEGISRYKNNKLRNWKEENNTLLDNNCEAILNAGNGKLFACTEKGVVVLNPSIENAITTRYNYKKKYALYPELMGGFDAGNQNWYFYGSQGLYKLEREQLVEDSIAGFDFATVYINKIVKDKQSQYWLATLGHGLLKCIYKSGRLTLLKQYNQANGLPSNDVLSVLIDKNNQIWLADYMSLSLLQNKGLKENVITFNEQDGLLNAYYQNLKLAQQKDGTIWGITSMGIFSFHPDSLKQNILNPLITLNKVTVNPNSTNRLALVEKQLLQNAVFNYNQNSFQFNFTAISLSDPTKIKYQYRLLGLDSNWIITSARLADFNFLNPGKYIFEVKAANNSQVWTTNPSVYKFTIQLPFWQTGWFITMVILFLIALIFFIFKRRVRSIRNKEAIRQQLAELEGKVLRAQMNPHFIFNSLNAIQECIVLQKTDAAFGYLSKFSKLLRLVLNNSEKEFITLQEEVKMINLYLELESLRFNHSFSYQIIMDEELIEDSVTIPPLLLQPYIENAIWHGLLTKKGDKKLYVSCKKLVDGYEWRVEDNGIGRKQAAILKAQKLGSNNFDSKGMRLNQDRLQLMNKQHENKFELFVEDLEDDAGVALGTLVILKLFIKSD